MGQTQTNISGEKIRTAVEIEDCEDCEVQSIMFASYIGDYKAAQVEYQLGNNEDKHVVFLRTAFVKELIDALEKGGKLQVCRLPDTDRYRVVV